MPNRTLTQLERIRDRYEVISLVDEGMINAFSAAEALNISVRHVYRLLGRFRYYQRNKLCFVFKRRGRPKGKSMKTREAVLRLKKESPNRSITLIAERVSAECERISTYAVREILKQNGLYQKKRKKRKKSYTRFEAQAFGSLWQMDTCEGYWLDDHDKVHLILILDDHSRMIVGSRFVDSDSTWNNMDVIRSAIEAYGIPKIIYTDNDSKFKVIRHESRFFKFKDNIFYETEIQRVLFELGIVPLTHKPYQPQAKGKIERLFRFIRGRFIPEHTAKTLEELNDQFGKWTDWYNTQRRHQSIEDVPASRGEPSVTRKILEEVNLDDIFSSVEVRLVKKDNSISFGSKGYFLELKENLAGEKVELRIRPEKMRIFHKGRFLKEFKLN
jgi:putative transposase